MAAPTIANKLATSLDSHFGDFNTASITPVLNRLYMLHVFAESDSADNLDFLTPTHSAGSIVFTRASNFAGIVSGGNVWNMATWYGLGVGTTAGTINIHGQTITLPAHLLVDDTISYVYILDEIAGCTITGSNGADAMRQTNNQGGTASSGGATLSAFLANSAQYACWAHRKSNVITPEHTKVAGVVLGGAPASIATGWESPSSDVTTFASWGTSTNFLVTSFEIKAGPVVLSQATETDQANAVQKARKGAILQPEASNVANRVGAAKGITVGSDTVEEARFILARKLNLHHTSLPVTAEPDDADLPIYPFSP